MLPIVYNQSKAYIFFEEGQLNLLVGETERYQLINHGNITCLSPPPSPTLPPVKSMVIRDVTTPPPRSPPPTLRIVLRIALRMLPYVAPYPRSRAWMKQNVMAPVDVIFDRACSQSIKKK